MPVSMNQPPDNNLYQYGRVGVTVSSINQQWDSHSYYQQDSVSHRHWPDTPCATAEVQNQKHSPKGMLRVKLIGKNETRTGKHTAKVDSFGTFLDKPPGKNTKGKGAAARGKWDPAATSEGGSTRSESSAEQGSNATDRQQASKWLDQEQSAANMKPQTDRLDTSKTETGKVSAALAWLEEGMRIPAPNDVPLTELAFSAET